MFIYDNCYYTDSNYQLELNLQSIRRELISMMEEFEKRDCAMCKQLKCQCSDSKPAPAQTDSGRNSQASCKSPHSKHNQTPTSNKSHTPKEAPPADVLPKPKWDEAKAGTTQASTPEKSTKDIEAWVRTVTTVAPPNVPQYKRYEHDLGEPAFNWSGLKSTWDKKTSLEILGSINGVEAFFRSFKTSSLPHSSAQTNVSYVSNKLAAAFKVKPKKSYEYTYF